jgi:vancomycin resistance protein VanJ
MMSLSLTTLAIARVIWKLLLAASLLYGLAVSGYLVARVVVGERWNWIAFANNFVPWWALGNAVLIVIVLFSRERWLLVACQLPGIVAFVILYGDLLLPPDHPVEASGGTPITAATYNILSIVSDPQRVRDQITALDADIVGLEEVGPDHAQTFAADLAQSYPYQAVYPHPQVSGIGLLSRCPILEEKLFRLLPDSMYGLRAVVEINGVPVTVYVVHPHPPERAHSPFTYDDDIRNAEIAVLVNDYLAHESGPLIVLGDFNMTDQSDAYRQMDGVLSDAFREAGRGMGFTFPGSTPLMIRLFPRLLRIDYVWHSADFRAYAAFVADDSGTSDHHPVVARLALEPAPNTR